MALSLLDGLDLSKIPGGFPPPGVTPNLVDPPDDLGPATIAMTCALTAVMLVFVLLRFLSKVLVMKKYGQEDVYCAIATVLTVGYMGLIIYEFSHGFGRYPWDIPLSVLLDPSLTKVTKAISFIYPATMIFVKLSILALYYRLFSPLRKFRWMIYVGVVYSVVLHLTVLLTMIWICQPSDPIGYSMCDSKVIVVGEWAGVPNIVGDFYLLAIPLLAISSLQISRKQKMGVLAIFATGLLACCASVIGFVVRVVFISNTTNGTWYAAWMLMPASLELNAGIIIGCMPIIPALLRSEKLRSMTSRTLWRTSTSRFRSTDAQDDRGAKTSHGSIEGSKAPVPMGSVRVVKSFDAESSPGSSNEKRIKEMV